MRSSCSTRYTIARLCAERHADPFDRAVYRLRNRVERLINRCKQFRGLTARYDRCAASYGAPWLTVMTILWIKAAHRRQALVAAQELEGLVGGVEDAAGT